MTSQVVINNIVPRTQIISTSAQLIFDTDWTANADSDINVYVTAVDAVPNDVLDLASPSDYNVSYIGNEETVRITFHSGITLNAVVTIARNTPADRLNLYTNTNFTPSMLNQDVGILTLVDQQNEMYDKNITPHYNVCAQFHSDPLADLMLPILPPYCTWVMNSTATGIDAIPVSGGGGGGTVNPSIKPNIAWYAESGTAVSGFPSVANALLGSTESKDPQWLPSTTNRMMGSNSTGPEWFGPFAQGEVAMGGSGGVPVAGQLVGGDGITIDTSNPGQVIFNSSTTSQGPTCQIFSSGSGTYVKPAGVQWIEIEAIGGGGGGAGSGAGAGTPAAGAGGTTQFGAIIDCTGGSPGATYSGTGGGGAGGVGSHVSPAAGYGVTGGSGTSGGQFLNSGAGDCVFSGGTGGSGALGGSGGGGGSGNAGAPGVRGGGGGGASGVWSGGDRTVSGGGGGAGGYIRAIVPSPAGTYAYIVGAGGTAGGPGPIGTNGDPAYAGGAGGAGMIVVFEYY